MEVATWLLLILQVQLNMSLQLYYFCSVRPSYTLGSALLHTSTSHNRQREWLLVEHLAAKESDIFLKKVVESKKE